MLWPLLVLLVPLFFWVLVDTMASVRSRKFRSVTLHSVNSRDDFEVLVPIYGNAKYLQNYEYLHTYGNRVILCTTSGETSEFYDALRVLSDQYGFRVFRSAYIPETTTKKKRTGGIIRDRVVRDALVEAVTMPYVVCIDADTTTPLPLGVLIGEIHDQDADLASVRLVPQSEGSMLVRLQQHEYRLAMRMRFLIPWLVSGACHAGKTEALRHIMQCHSLFFQGNDVETGLLGEQLGYRVVHVPFDVHTDVPDSWKAWWRQRLAWSGGEFRLFIANFRYVTVHPFLWLYGAVITIAMFAFRWYAIASPTIALLIIAALYYAVIFWLHWESRNRWLLLMPLYTLFSSLIITPLGIIWYFVMSIPEKNFGIIRPNAELGGTEATTSA